MRVCNENTATAVAVVVLLVLVLLCPHGGLLASPDNGPDPGPSPTTIKQLESPRNWEAETSPAQDRIIPPNFSLPGNNFTRTKIGLGLS